MKPKSLTIAAISFIVGASIALAVIRAFEIGDVPLAFVVGAIIGTQAGAFMHAREPGSTTTVGVKLVLGAVLAVVAVVFGAAVHFSPGGLPTPEITLPISAVGSFVFPFAVFDPTFNAARPKRDKE